MSKAKWITPERQNHLVELFIENGLKCQQGHINCPILEHYLHLETKVSSVARGVEKLCYDGNGNVLKDKQGNDLYITVFQSVPVIETKQSLLTKYELQSETCIDNWQADDKQRKQAEWEKERYQLHTLHEKRKPLRGKFSAVSSAIWRETQPIYYLESIGIDALRMKPYAKVKMSGSYFHLFIDLGDSLRELSKNRKRKAIRYHKALPSQVNDRVSDTIMRAVNHYLDS